MNRSSQRAAAELIGAGFSLRSVDGVERAALLRVLADNHALTPSARAYALRLGALYGDVGPRELRKLKDRPLADVTGSASAFSSSASFLSAEVKGRKDAPRLQSFASLLRDTRALVPSALNPVTKASATAALRAAGASATEAKRALDELKVGGAELFVGRAFSYDASSSTSVPRDVGLVLLSATGDGKRVRAIVVPQQQPAPGGDAVREAIRHLTGVDRAIDVVTARGAFSFALEWRTASGAVVAAELDHSDPSTPVITSASAPPVLEAALRDTLASHLRRAFGADRDVVGWVGRDDANGPGFVVAHKAPGTLAPITLSTIRIALGGVATVTPRALDTSAADRELARDLALVLSRAHAERMVEGPAVGPAARLEVALRTRDATVDALLALDASTSPVGFDPARERTQWMLPRVWGDNAVVVTFANDGTLRVEDVN